MYRRQASHILSLQDSIVHKCVDVLRYFTGFHRELQSNAVRCSEYVRANAKKGDASSVVAAIDAFANGKSFMHIGGARGAIIDSEINRTKPSVMVEVGAYIGYSAIRFASTQQQALCHENKRGQYYTFEYSPTYAEISRQMIEFAGLTDNIHLIEGSFSEKLHALQNTSVDMLFLDHAKDLYTSDLRHALDANILHPGSVIIADNVLYPGAPKYLDFFEANRQRFATHLHTFKTPAIGGLTFKDGVHVAFINLSKNPVKMRKNMTSPMQRALSLLLSEKKVIDFVIEQHRQYLPDSIQNASPHMFQNFANGAFLCALLTRKYPTSLTEPTLRSIQWNDLCGKSYNLQLFHNYMQQMQPLKAKDNQNGCNTNQISPRAREICALESIRNTVDISDLYKQLYEWSMIQSERLFFRQNFPNVKSVQTDSEPRQQSKTTSRIPILAKRRVFHPTTMHAQQQSSMQHFSQSPSKLRRPSIVSPMKRTMSSPDRITYKNNSNVTVSEDATKSKQKCEEMKKIDMDKKKKEIKKASMKANVCESRIPRLSKESHVKGKSRSFSSHSFVTLQEVKKQNSNARTHGKPPLQAIETRHSKSFCSMEEDDDDETISVSSAGEENISPSKIGHKRRREAPCTHSETHSPSTGKIAMERECGAPEDICTFENITTESDKDSLKMMPQNQKEEEHNMYSSVTTEDMLATPERKPFEFFSEPLEPKEVAEALYMDLRRDNARLHLKMEHFNAEINYMYDLLTRIEKRLHYWKSKADPENPTSDTSSQITQYTMIIEKLEGILRAPKASHAVSLHM